MPRSHLELLYHISGEIAFLLSECSGVDEASFLAEEKAKRAYARSIEIIGEATKNLPDAPKSVNGEASLDGGRLRCGRQGL